MVGVLFGLPLPLFSADLPTILKRGRLIVAVKENIRPLAFRGSDGQLQGFEIDVARQLAQELLDKPDAVVLQPVLNQDRLATVLDGRADLAIARVTKTPMRSQVVSFSSPYYLDGTALISRDPNLRRLSDLGRGPIAVLENSSTVAVLRRRLPQVGLVPVSSYVAAKQQLQTGAAIAFAADASVLSGWAQEDPAYHLLLPTLSSEPLAIVLPKGLQYESLRQQIQAILAGWQRSGWLKERAAYWGLP